MTSRRPNEPSGGGNDCLGEVIGGPTIDVIRKPISMSQLIKVSNAQTQPAEDYGPATNRISTFPKGHDLQFPDEGHKNGKEKQAQCLSCKVGTSGELSMGNFPNKCFDMRGNS